MSKKTDNKTLLYVGGGLAIYFFVNRVASALGIKSEAEQQQAIQNEIDNSQKYIVTRIRTVNGKKVSYQVNLQTVARQLYEDMGGNNFLGINYSFVPTSAPVDTLKTVAPVDMKTIAMLYLKTYTRNLKEDLLHRLYQSDINTPTVQAYLNAF